MKLATTIGLFLAVLAASAVAQDCDGEFEFVLHSKVGIVDFKIAGNLVPLQGRAQALANVLNATIQRHMPGKQLDITILTGDFDASSPQPLKRESLQDYDVLVLPTMINSLFSGLDEDTRSGVHEWISLGGRVVVLGGQDIAAMDVAAIFPQESRPYLGAPSPSWTQQGVSTETKFTKSSHVSDTPLCDNDMVPTEIPEINGVWTQSNFEVDNQPVNIFTSDPETTGLYFLINRVHDPVITDASAVFIYTQPQEDFEGGVAFVGYSFDPALHSDSSTQAVRDHWADILVLIVYGDAKQHEGCGTEVPGLFSYRPAGSSRPAFAAYECGPNSIYLTDAQDNDCDGLRVRLPEGYPAHQQVTMYRIPHADSLGPLAAGDEC